MLFQIILALLIFIALVRLFAQFYEKRINAFFFFFFLMVWITVLFLNWNTAILNRIGHLLGIDPGANILTYIGLFLLFYYVFVSIIKFYKMEQDIDALVKKDAVDNFLKKYDMKDK